MVEINKARAAERELTEQLRHVKDGAAQQVESYRMRASKVETEVATLRGRSDRLTEEITAPTSRIRRLQDELAREREAAAALAMAQAKVAAPVRRITNQRLHAAVPLCRWKL
jgi:predicted RecB family endonuclease